MLYLWYNFSFVNCWFSSSNSLLEIGNRVAFLSFFVRPWLTSTVSILGWSLSHNLQFMVKGVHKRVLLLSYKLFTIVTVWLYGASFLNPVLLIIKPLPYLFYYIKLLDFRFHLSRLSPLSRQISRSALLRVHPWEINQGSNIPFW